MLHCTGFTPNQYGFRAGYYGINQFLLVTQEVKFFFYVRFEVPGVPEVPF